MGPAFSVYYRFSQNFRFPARQAYRWSTSYHQKDISLMGLEGQRKVERLAPDTFILTDTIIHGGRGSTKVKLVRLNPRRLSWTSTHLSGPNKHSQFLYEILPVGERASRLVFTGLQVCYSDRKPTAKERAEMARKERKADAATWKNLAREMERDLGRAAVK
jgi:hypothetical protein